jgi:hypothetical protein
LAGDYFVESRRLAQQLLAFGRELSLPDNPLANPPRRKEECEGDDGDEKGIVEMQTKEKKTRAASNGD